MLQIQDLLPFQLPTPAGFRDIMGHLGTHCQLLAMQSALPSKMEEQGLTDPS